MIRSRIAILAGLGVFGSQAANDLPPEQLKIGGAVFDVEYQPGEFDLPRQALRKWIADAAEAVSGYFGQFPVKRVRIRVFPAPGRSGIFHGTTWGREPGGLTRISVGQHTTAEELADDWMMTHELTHMGFPSVDDPHHWIEEGMATYVEPVSRAQAGHLDVNRMWSDLVRYMPQGEPEAGDEGLDRTHTWARTYWGGGLFCLLADVRIRERTHNRLGLQDALRGIVAAGGTIQAEWPLERALAIGGQATGTTVLRDMYQEMKNKPVHVDLGALWKQLGIEKRGQEIVFHDDAPLADARKAITRKRAL